ncbi:MAG: TonB-dependent receptor [Candidatus Nitrohelix vancouverensis]|uniref:TonB-dependent receptor n=1 Tax=Candidatus Nitrohelix vancouverensis TaxID=2705534 RepID=A0A7T0C0B4_9BACT|nr:MAG: TonB-dependent receptor [Candidatus Nitrohelix vancouverensis]
MVFSKRLLNIIALLLFLQWLDGVAPHKGFAESIDDTRVANSNASKVVDEELDALMELDLEDLLVTVASKQDEKLSDAPGIITVITAKDIKNYGANNLMDLLSRLPNVYGYGTAAGMNSVTSIRGQTLGFQDVHVLFLLNGRPMRENVAGGLNIPIYSTLPLNAIERIEIIRGPGSALYGTGAFSGVVNIILKNSESEEANAFQAGYGSFDTKTAAGIVSGKKDDWDYMVSGNVADAEGWRFSMTDENNVNNTTSLNQKTHGMVAHASKNGFTFTGASLYDARQNLGSTPNWPISHLYEIRRSMFDLQYEQELTQNWKATWNFTYNLMDLVNSTDTDFLSENMHVEGAVRGKLFDRVNLLAGGVYKRLGDDPGVGRTFWVNEHSLYAQADYDVFKSLNLLVGLQLNKVRKVDYDLSPRFAAVWHITPELGVKTLYSKAFRSPTAGELKVFTASFIGNESLRPETIKTFDAQIFYKKSNLFTALTYYDSRQKDTIELVSSGAAVTPRNGEKVHYQGVEWEWKLKPEREWEFSGSLSYQVNENDSGSPDVGRISNFMAKAGVLYQSPQGYSVGLFNSHFSDAQRINSARRVNPEAEAYNLLTLNASMDVPKKMIPGGWPDVRLNLYVDNLLDEDIYFPEVIRGIINTIPIHSGIGAFGQIVLKF